MVLECGQVDTAQISHRLYSRFPHLLTCDSADSKQAVNRQRHEKCPIDTSETIDKTGKPIIDPEANKNAPQQGFHRARLLTQRAI
jgi:hypothetical protein